MDRTSSGSISATPRSHALDGLRGYAAAAVAIYHGILHNDLSLIDRVLYKPIHGAATPGDILAKLALTIQNGETAVFLFFILSGAVLHLSLQRQEQAPVLATLGLFLRNRVLRLYPPLLVCLLLMFVASRIGLPGFPAWDIRAMLENASLWSAPVHGPSETLRAEIMAVPFILIAWLLRRLFGMPGLLLAFIYSVLAIDFMPLAFGLPSMHVYLMAFMGGMLAAEPGARGFMQQVPARSWWLVLALLVFGRMLHWHGSHTALITMVISGSILVSGMLYCERGSLKRLLESSFSQKLGKLSFSLYLYAVPAQFFLWAYTDRLAWPRVWPVAGGIVIGLASLLLAWPLAYLSERWVERPFISLGRRRAGAAQEAKPGLHAVQTS